MSLAGAARASGKAPCGEDGTIDLCTPPTSPRLPPYAESAAAAAAAALVPRDEDERPAKVAKSAYREVFPGLIYVNNYLARAHADALLASLHADILGEEKGFLLYDKPVRSGFYHRGMGMFATEPTSYTFSGTTLLAHSMPPYLASLTRQVNEFVESSITGINPRFNGVLINHYRGGNDNLGAHSDANDYLGAGGAVIGLTLGGGNNKIRFRSINRAPDGKISMRTVADLTTLHGQLYGMVGESFQKSYTHEVLKSENGNERVSITWRRHEKVARDFARPGIYAKK